MTLTPEDLLDIANRKRVPLLSLYDITEDATVCPQPLHLCDGGVCGIVQSGVSFGHLSPKLRAYVYESQHPCAPMPEKSQDLNPFRRLREKLRLTQAEIAAELDISLASVQNYEAGKRPSEGALEKMKSLAMDRGLVSLAAELDVHDFHVKATYGPGDDARLKRLPRKGSGSDMAEQLHAALDSVLDSGRPDLIVTVESVLRLAASILDAPDETFVGGRVSRKGKR